MYLVQGAAIQSTDLSPTPVCPAPFAKPLFPFSVLPLALGMSAATAARGSSFLVPSRSSRPNQNSVGWIGSKGISGKCSLQK